MVFWGHIRFGDATSTLRPSGGIGRRAGFKIQCPPGRPSSSLGAGTQSALIAQRIEQMTSNHQVRGSSPRGGTEGGEARHRPGGFDSRRLIALLCESGPRRRVSLTGLDSPVGILVGSAGSPAGLKG